jgi:peptide/nickel transport system ATP-binding protein
VSGAAAEALLEISGLTVGFATERGPQRVVEEVSFSVSAGDMVGLVGESGCGKSVTAMAIMRLLPVPPARMEAGEIRFEGRDLLKLDEGAMCDLRGNRIGMIFQEPMTSLNPTFTIGFQIDEVLRAHRSLSAASARAETIELLTRVGFGAAARRVDQYPHQLSGGLRQRVMIAMALACGPQLLIADEPTTALDVTIQAQILELLRRLQRELGMAILLITHDLGVIAEFAREVVVMYAGRIVEKAAVGPLFAHPRHPYTAGLLASIPRIADGRTRLPSIPGMVPQPTERGDYCSFAARCPRALDICRAERPPLAPLADGHLAACWNPQP